MDGKEMCKLSKEEFLDRTPGCVGDILYEHLQLLQHDADRNESPAMTNNNDFKTEPHQDPQHSPLASSQGSVQDDIIYEQLMDHSNGSKHLETSNNNDNSHSPPPPINNSNSPPNNVQPNPDFHHRSFEDVRQIPINYSQTSNYDPSSYGNASTAIYAAMNAFRSPYPPMASNPQQFLTPNPYSDHYQFPHSAYNPAMFQGHVSYKFAKTGFASFLNNNKNERTCLNASDKIRISVFAWKVLSNERQVHSMETATPFIFGTKKLEGREIKVEWW